MSVYFRKEHRFGWKSIYNERKMNLYCGKKGILPFLKTELEAGKTFRNFCVGGCIEVERQICKCKRGRTVRM